jgi:hypothetical protein
VSKSWERIEIVFFRNILWCLFWLVIWNDAHRSKGTAAEIIISKTYPCTRRGSSSPVEFPAACSGWQRGHFYTDYAVLKLQLKIPIMWIYLWNERTTTVHQYNEVYNGIRFISIRPNSYRASYKKSRHTALWKILWNLAPPWHYAFACIAITRTPLQIGRLIGRFVDDIIWHFFNCG